MSKERLELLLKQMEETQRTIDFYQDINLVLVTIFGVLILRQLYKKALVEEPELTGGRAVGTVQY